MKRLLVKTGQPCEIDCIYCKRNYYHQKGVGSRAKEDVKKEVSEAIKEYGSDLFVRFTGVGEPLMLPNLLDICKELHKNHIPFELETNALKLADKELCRKFIRLGLNRVEISLNSHIPSVYKKIVGGYDCYGQVMQAIKNLEEFKVPIHISTVILKQNVNHFHRVPTFVRRNFPQLKILSINLHLVRINGPLKMFKEVAFPLSQYYKDIENSIKNLKDSGFNLGFSTSAGAFPFCFFPMLIKSFDYDKTNFGDDNMHVKTKYCKGCAYYNSCRGVSNTYIELYGEEEFRNRKFHKKINY